MDKRAIQDKYCQEVEDLYNEKREYRNKIIIIRKNSPFTISEDDRVTGHIYNLNAWGIGSGEIDEGRLLRAIATILTRNNISVYGPRSCQYIVRDTLGDFHSLYANHGTIWEERPRNVSQIFADGMFTFRPLREEYNQLIVSDFYESHREEIREYSIPRFVPAE